MTHMIILVNVLVNSFLLTLCEVPSINGPNVARHYVRCHVKTQNVKQWTIVPGVEIINIHKVSLREKITKKSPIYIER